MLRKAVLNSEAEAQDGVDTDCLLNFPRIDIITRLPCGRWGTQNQRYFRMKRMD